jgi:starch synthase
LICRFNFFCGAALEYLKTRNVQPSVIHCHDWQTAPVAWGDRGRARCVFTIHNLDYGADLVAKAMSVCEVATTVSPTYAREVRRRALCVAECYLVDQSH